MLEFGENAESNNNTSRMAENFDDDLPEMSFNYDYDDGVGSLPLDLDSDGNPQQRKASIASCIITLLNTVAGAGMLGLPGAYAGSGLFMGTVLLVVAAFFSALGLHLLAVSATTAQARQGDGKPASFYSVATAAMPEFAIFIDGAVALKCFGVATGYFVTVAFIICFEISLLRQKLLWRKLRRWFSQTGNSGLFVLSFACYPLVSSRL